MMTRVDGGGSTRGDFHPLTTVSGRSTNLFVPADDPAVTAASQATDDAIRQQVQRLVAESVFRRWPLSASLPQRRSPPPPTAALPATAGGAR